MSNWLLFVLFSQFLVFGSLDRISRAMEKREYAKAYELIQKGLDKEPENAGISYYKASLFFDPAFDHYHIDTARSYIRKAQKDFMTSGPEQKEKYLDDGIDSFRIVRLATKIRDREFQQTLDPLSLATILRFQRLYPTSVYADLLQYKQDSIEFDLARTAASQEALISFIEDHPISIFKPKADTLLDKMRYTQLKKEGVLDDYYHFLSQYPLSPNRSNVEAYVLKVSTVGHSAEEYAHFMTIAANPYLRKKAGDVLYYLLKQEVAGHPMKDSLHAAHLANGQRLFPVIEEGSYGFFNTVGNRVIPAVYQGIDSSYFCRSVQDHCLYVQYDNNNKGKVITKAGHVLLEEVDGYESLTSDLAMVKRSGQYYLFHKSGFFVLNESIEHSELIDPWIKVKKNGKWGLYTRLGYPISEVKYDDIYKEGPFWIFEKRGRLAISTEKRIRSEVEVSGLSLQFTFGEVELVNETMLIGYSQGRECLLDEQLQFLISWGDFEIFPDEAGWYTKSAQGYRLYNTIEEEVMDRYFPYLESNRGWLALQTEKDWMLLPRGGDRLPTRGYDSIKLVNDFATITIREGSAHLKFLSGKQLPLQNEIVSVFPERPNFIKVSQRDKMRILDPKGQLIISGRYTEASFINDTLLRVEQQKKQGLMHLHDGWILDPVFDVIDTTDELILTLKNGKIGCYDPVSNQQIAANYESRLGRYGSHYLAKKGGHYGIIDKEGEQVLSFSYDEIDIWNDTTHLVKKDDGYFLINTEEEILSEKYHQLKKLSQTEGVRIYRYVRNGKYGLLSDRDAELLPAAYSDVSNIGSMTEPVFFADQHLSKAEFHVVTYLNDSGEKIISKAYTKEEFDKIMCDD